MRNRPFFVRVAILALLSAPALALVLFAAATAAGVEGRAQALGALLPVSVLFLGLGVALRFSGRPLYATAVISFLVSLPAVVTGAEYGVLHPEEFFEFTASVVLAASSITALVASVGAIVTRKTSAVASTAKLRRLFLAVPIVAGSAILFSAVVSILAEPTIVRQGQPAQLVTANNRFLPREFSVIEGERVSFDISNEDDEAHTFSIDELEIDQYLGPSSDRQVTFRVDLEEPATALRLYCAINGHEAMVGTIRVTKDGRS